jgi:adenylylsulfate kinase
MKASSNTVMFHGSVTRVSRSKKFGNVPVLLWFTGISGSGKSTISHAVDERLFDLGYHSIVLDGDNIRHGLCNDLGFSDDDRRENIRRVGEVSKILLDAGVIAIASLISPFNEGRDNIKKEFSKYDFYEIYVKCPIEVCESRDVKGNYKLARLKKIDSFTAIDSPYEEPSSPNLVLTTNVQSIEESVNLVMEMLFNEKIIKTTGK